MIKPKGNHKCQHVTIGYCLHWRSWMTTTFVRGLTIRAFFGPFLFREKAGNKAMPMAPFTLRENYAHLRERRGVSLVAKYQMACMFCTTAMFGDVSVPRIFGSAQPWAAFVIALLAKLTDRQSLRWNRQERRDIDWLTANRKRRLHVC